MTTPLLEINNLCVSFRMYESGTRQRDLKAVSGLSITANAGEILAIAGSSGAGKSLLAHAVLGLLPQNAALSGEMLYKGDTLNERLQKKLRGSEIALIPQSVGCLDPLMRVGKQATGAGSDSGKIKLGQDVFKRLGLNSQTERLYPFQLSGGMARRVLFSTAIISGANLIIADEATPGMQVEQAVEALSILRELANAGKAVVLITHDIDLAVRFADKIAVFYAGATVEEALASDFTAGQSNLRHPYSKALWNALPQNEFVPVGGAQPYAGALPSGCLFAPRCPLKTEECERETPAMRELRGGLVRCIHAA